VNFISFGFHLVFLIYCFFNIVLDQGFDSYCVLLLESCIFKDTNPRAKDFSVYLILLTCSYRYLTFLYSIDMRLKFWKVQLLLAIKLSRIYESMLCVCVSVVLST